MKTLQQQTILELLELVQQLHSRSGMFPHSRDIHNAWVDASVEIVGRINNLEAANTQLLDELNKTTSTLGGYLLFPHPSELLDRIETLEQELDAAYKKLGEQGNE